MNTRQFEDRKRDHIRHALNPAHQATGFGGLDAVHLVHEAMPELDLAEIRLATPCLGRELATPFYVAGMTAGHPDARELNFAIARACAERGWAMGVGSQRRELHEPVGEWSGLRDELPGLMLFANLGLSQLASTPVDRVVALARSLRADAIAVHANALQEALQPEGTPSFKGALAALKRLCAESAIPVVLKETGCGFSRVTVERLHDIGLRALDVSGLGGTHWGRIEGARADEASLHARAAATFAGWGEPTVDSVLAARGFAGSGRELWASGGVRSGLDAAKLIALGAERVGFAKPALEAALAGPAALRTWMAQIEFELKIALFCTGTESPARLRAKENAWTARSTA